MRIVPTNDLLLKYKIKTSNICDFCNMNVETAKHMFWECRHIQHIWNEVTTFLQTKNIYINLNFEIISFGLIKNMKNPITIMKNYIILCAKYFIFLSKCHINIPLFNCFINYLYSQIDIEKYIAQQRDRLESHENKWRFLF